MFTRSSKFQRIQKKRFPLLNKKVILPILFFILASGLIWGFFQYAKTSFVISLDEISCANDLSVLNMLQQEKVQFYWLDQVGLEKKLKQKFSCAKQVAIKVKLPNTVVVSMSGRKPVAVFRITQKNLPLPLPLTVLEATGSTGEAKPTLIPTPIISFGTNFLMDEDGVAYAEGSRDGLPIINLVSQKFGVGDSIGKERMAKLKSALQFFLSQDIKITENEVEESRFTLKSSEDIIFSLDEDLDRQIASLQLIWKQAKINSKSIVKIDLRFDKPVVTYAPDKKK